MINLNAKKYTLNIVHVNGILHKIINIPSYSAAVQWARNVQIKSTMMIVIVDDEGNTEDWQACEDCEVTTGQTFYQCDQTNRKWWA